MRVLVKGDKLLLDQHDHVLRSNIKGQLKAWGFRFDKDVYVLDHIDGAILQKVIVYLDKKGEVYQLDVTAIAVLNQFNDKIKKYSNKIDTLRNYKCGVFDPSLLSAHLASLDGLPRRLKDHQIKASLHLYLAENSANFSVPGSGKTTVVLSVYERLKNEGVVDALFVIGPLSCFGAWKEEFYEAIGRRPKTAILAGGDRNERIGNYFNYTNHSELYLTSFQTNMMDYDYVSKLLERINIFLVVDEAHYIKRANGEWASAVLSVAPYAVRRVALTGTPMPKGYSDIFNLVEFLYPEYTYLDVGSKIKLNRFQEQNSINEAKELIEEKVGPLFYRVRKKELNLKAQIIKDPVMVVMNKYERLIYDAIVTKIVNYADKDYLNNIDYVNTLIRGRMIRLRQCVSYAGLLSKPVEEYDEDLLNGDLDLANIVNNYDILEAPSKLTQLTSLVEELLLRKEKVIVWSNFIGTINLIDKTLKSKGVFCKKIIGATPVETEKLSREETRESIRNEFVDPDSKLRVLLANPAACAESISLHICCNNAVYYDLSYNCAQYLQSLDRIHRVGASEIKESYYYILQYQDTMDPDILDNLIHKSNRMMQIIDSDYAIQDMDMFENNDEIEAYKRLFRNA